MPSVGSAHADEILGEAACGLANHQSHRRELSVWSTRSFCKRLRC